jgi:exodeoxyribonuclease VII small subunit
MAKEKKQNDVSKLSFEDAIKDLTQIVAKIEGGQTALDESIDQYENGMALIKHCRSILQVAEKKIEKISADDTKADDDTDEEKTELF